MNLSVQQIQPRVSLSQISTSVSWDDASCDVHLQEAWLIVSTSLVSSHPRFRQTVCHEVLSSLPFLGECKSEVIVNLLGSTLLEEEGTGSKGSVAAQLGQFAASIRACQPQASWPLQCGDYCGRITGALLALRILISTTGRSRIKQLYDVSLLTVQKWVAQLHLQVQ